MLKFHRSKKEWENKDAILMSAISCSNLRNTNI